MPSQVQMPFTKHYQITGRIRSSAAPLHRLFLQQALSCKSCLDTITFFFCAPRRFQLFTVLPLRRCTLLQTTLRTVARNREDSKGDGEMRKITEYVCVHVCVCGYGGELTDLSERNWHQGLGSNR